ncbi:MAG TPA: alpha/beta hydrolase [Solirubrobacterales bacterium]|jgi:pimeloyl-ACP methyl ester carboxylesterase|nr:alpha/beta hydrolase [Solirubrobacterales bacterium]
MKLHTRHWGNGGAHSVVCVHGIGQHGGIFGNLAQRLAAQGHSVLAVDLRGHGDSGREPPWNTDTHAADVLATLDSLGIEQASWVGHSFGGRLGAVLATAAPERTKALAMLDPGLEISPTLALRSAEIDRLDWSFATVDGAINALLSSDAVVAAPREVVKAYAEDDLRKGPDDRYRFRFSPSAVVAAWSEVTLPAPPIAPVPTLLLTATVSLVHAGGWQGVYREALGDLLTEVVVPNGHNVLWEAPEETISAIEGFLGPA